MELHRIIKCDARRSLRGCWGKSIAAAMVLFGSYLAVAISESVLLFVFSEESASLDFLSITNASLTAIVITGLAALAYFLLMPALSLGFTKLHLTFAEGREESVSVVFDMFSSFKWFVKSLPLLWLSPCGIYSVPSSPSCPGASFSISRKRISSRRSAPCSCSKSAPAASASR